MKTLRRSIYAALLCSAASASVYAAPKQIDTSLSSQPVLQVATWNVEHLAFPADQGCRPRTEDELVTLQAYANNLTADIVALQEVGSYEAVENLFPSEQWQIFVSERKDTQAYDCRNSGFKSTQQKVAFAVRKSLIVEQVDSLANFGVGNPGLRHGLELTVNSAMGPVTLLNVHMKSGCFVDNYSREQSRACKSLAKQVPVLDAWIEQKEQESKPYIVLGDFNHRLSASYNHLTQTLTNNSDNSASSLQITTKDLIGCHPYYPAPIDHILLGHVDDNKFNNSVSVHAYKDMNPKAMLSDHCAVSLSISPKNFELSNAVKWQTTSAEYRFLTAATYQRAQQQIANSNFDGNWAVVMDVDETVLDNSGYQANLEMKGQQYSPASWDAWVMSKQATFVPGAKAFIETVIRKGGKVALVTNRNRHLDRYTWDNIQQLGLSLSTDNTCLMGRVAKDKSSINGASIKNDKDLRRQQVESGTASCFAPKSDRHNHFDAAKIIMQVGDNIEDFSGVVQHDVDIDMLLKSEGIDFVLLPNPMYGSW